ncbi:hypothetical protein [Scytonema sp. NUACC21]
MRTFGRCDLPLCCSEAIAPLPLIMTNPPIQNLNMTDTEYAALIAYC